MFLRTDGAPSPVSAERQSRTRRPPRGFCGPAISVTLDKQVPPEGGGLERGNAKRTRKKEHPPGALFLLESLVKRFGTVSIGSSYT